MGAIEPASWQDWHFSWKIGAMSFVNVTFFCGVWALAIAGRRSMVPAPASHRQFRGVSRPSIVCSFRSPNRSLRGKPRRSAVGQWASDEQIPCPAIAF
jgi:hypothetical protein